MHVPRSRFALPVALTLTIAASVVSAVLPAVAATASPQVIRFHGGGTDRAGALAVDSAGNIYLAGSADSPNTNVTFTVVKLSPQGVLIWRAAYSGARGGVLGGANSVAVDAAGNVYAAGSISDGAIFGQNHDSLVVKFNSAGVEQWAQRYNGPVNGDDRATEIAVDQSGAIYVSGTSDGAGPDWVTRRLSPDGTPLWTIQHDGADSAEDLVSDMMLAPNGNVIVTGTTRNSGNGLTNDIEVQAYSPQGTIVWRQTWTDTLASHEHALDMDIASDGRIVVTGSTATSASPEFGIPSPIAVGFSASGAVLHAVRAGGGGVDIDASGSAYLAGSFTAAGDSATAKYDANGNQIWSTPLTLGSNEGLFVTAVAVDSSGVIVTGSLTNGGTLNMDYLTIRYSASGAELWRHRFNGTGNGDDRVTALAIDSDNAALVLGTSWSNYSTSGGTGHDMVTLKFPAGVIPGDTPPALAAPSQLSASSLSRSQIRLNWQDNSSNETGFRIERCKGAGCTNFVQVAQVGSGVTTHLDSGLSRNTSYTYRIRAFNPNVNSPFSNTATARTRLS